MAAHTPQGGQGTALKEVVCYGVISSVVRDLNYSFYRQLHGDENDLQVFLKFESHTVTTVNPVFGVYALNTDTNQLQRLGKLHPNVSIALSPFIKFLTIVGTIPKSVYHKFTADLNLLVFGLLGHSIKIGTWFTKCKVSLMPTTRCFNKRYFNPQHSSMDTAPVATEQMVDVSTIQGQLNAVIDASGRNTGRRPSADGALPGMGLGMGLGMGSAQQQQQPQFATSQSTSALQAYRLQQQQQQQQLNNNNNNNQHHHGNGHHHVQNIHQPGMNGHGMLSSMSSSTSVSSLSNGGLGSGVPSLDNGYSQQQYQQGLATINTSTSSPAFIQYQTNGPANGNNNGNFIQSNHHQSQPHLPVELTSHNSNDRLQSINQTASPSSSLSSPNFQQQSQSISDFGIRGSCQRQCQQDDSPNMSRINNNSNSNSNNRSMNKINIANSNAKANSNINGKANNNSNSTNSSQNLSLNKERKSLQQQNQHHQMHGVFSIDSLITFNNKAREMMQVNNDGSKSDQCKKDNDNKPPAKKFASGTPSNFSTGGTKRNREVMIKAEKNLLPTNNDDNNISNDGGLNSPSLTSLSSGAADSDASLDSVKLQRSRNSRFSYGRSVSSNRDSFADRYDYTLNYDDEEDLSDDYNNADVNDKTRSNNKSSSRRSNKRQEFESDALKSIKQLNGKQNEIMYPNQGLKSHSFAGQTTADSNFSSTSTSALNFIGIPKLSFETQRRQDIELLNQQNKIDDMVVKSQISSVYNFLQQPENSNNNGNIKIGTIGNNQNNNFISPSFPPLKKSKQPSQLVTQLLPHQLLGLNFLLSMENPLDFSRSLWRAHFNPDTGNGEGSGYWRHVITNDRTIDPPISLGGILADDMGLGKTIETISLIVSNFPHEKLPPVYKVVIQDDDDNDNDRKPPNVNNNRNLTIFQKSNRSTNSRRIKYLLESSLENTPSEELVDEKDVEVLDTKDETSLSQSQSALKLLRDRPELDVATIVHMIGTHVKEDRPQASNPYWFQPGKLSGLIPTYSSNLTGGSNGGSSSSSNSNGSGSQGQTGTFIATLPKEWASNIENVKVPIFSGCGGSSTGYLGSPLRNKLDLTKNQIQFYFNDRGYYYNKRDNNFIIGGDIGSKATLIVCPLSTVSNWEDQIKTHCKPGMLSVYVYHGVGRQIDAEILSQFDVVITTYNVLSLEWSVRDPESNFTDSMKKKLKLERLRGQTSGSTGGGRGKSGSKNPDQPVQPQSLFDHTSNSEDKKMSNDKETYSNDDYNQSKLDKEDKKWMNELEYQLPPGVGTLQRIHWWRIVLDEAHCIKEKITQQSKAASCLHSDRRWCLSGTPIQNKIDDIYGLLRFLKLKPFDDWNNFNQSLLKPLKLQQAVENNNSLSESKRLALVAGSNAVQRIQALMKSITLRRAKNHLIDGKPILTLPEKIMIVEKLKLTNIEFKLYKLLFNRARKVFFNLDSTGKALKKFATLLELLLRLRQVVTHPALYHIADRAFDTIEKNADKDDNIRSPQCAARYLNFLRELDSDSPPIPAITSSNDDGNSPNSNSPMSSIVCSVCCKNLWNNGRLIVTFSRGLYCSRHCFNEYLQSEKQQQQQGGQPQEQQQSQQSENPNAYYIISIQGDIITVPGITSCSPRSIAKTNGSVEKSTGTGSKSITNNDSQDKQSTIENLQSKRLQNLLVDAENDTETNEYFGDEEEDEVDDDDDNTGTVDNAIEELQQRETSIVSGSSHTITPPSSVYTRSRALTAQSVDMELEGSSSNIIADQDDDEPQDEEVKMILRRVRQVLSGDVGMKSSISENGGPKSILSNNNSNDTSSAATDSGSRKEILLAKIQNVMSELIPPFGSIKVERLINILKDTEVEGEGKTKTVIFSQWTTMLTLIENSLISENMKFTRLDGKMNRQDRDKALNLFKDDPTVNILLLSLKAGGVGLNLTHASQVIITEPFWNPAVELQAEDRVHRLGQTKKVKIIRFIIEDTIEELIIRMQDRKKQLAGLTLDKNGTYLKEKKEKDFNDALAGLAKEMKDEKDALKKTSNEDESNSKSAAANQFKLVQNHQQQLKKKRLETFREFFKNPI